MKGKVLFFLFLGVFYLQNAVTQSVYAQSLIDIYRNGTVRLVPDSGYAQNNDWEQVFALYYDTLYDKPMGNRKLMVMMPDRSIVVSHEYRNLYSLFDSMGTFMKEFSIVGASGKPIRDTKKIRGVMGQQFFAEPNNMGKMNCCDFNGRFVKSLTLDYMTSDMIALPNNKLAVVGWAIWKDKFRDFVVLVDYQTNKEKIIWSQFADRFDREPIRTYGRIRIATIKDKLIVALPKSGEILIYDFNGNLVSKDQFKTEKTFLSVEEQKEYKRKEIELLKTRKPPHISEETLETMLKRLERYIDEIEEPLLLPAFSNMIKDSDDNLLFFEIPENVGDNRFHVWTYQDGGKFIGKGRFQSSDYHLAITSDKMIFCNGYIYALQTLRNTQGNPLRLVRFKLSN